MPNHGDPGPYGVKMGSSCAVHRHRELVPLHVHHVHPLGDGGQDVAANRVTVCANGHYSTHALLDAMRKARRAGTTVSWRVRRQYGPKVRRYADQGLAAIVAAGRL